MAGGVRISVDVRPLRRFQAAMQPESPVMDRLFRRIAAVYSAFTRRRFVAYSRGGGSWPPLAASTLRRRRRGKGTGKAAILRDTGLLFMALTIGAAGNFLRRTRAGIVYGFGDNPHPRPASGKAGRKRRKVGAGAVSGTTLRQIASYHQAGGRRLPRRVILAQPDAQTRAQFNQMVRRAVLEAGAGAGAPAGGAR